MPKIVSVLVTTLIIFFLYFNLFLSPAFADNLSGCPAIKTDPSQLFSDPATTPKAKFFVTPNDKETKYASWKIQFESGVVLQDVGTATQDTSTGEVWREINNDMSAKSSGTLVGDPQQLKKFYPGAHTLKLIGVTDKNEEIPQCRATYNVTDSNIQCIVELSETTGIIPTSNLKVSGKKLTKDGMFGVFMDGEIIKGSHQLDFVSTPDFSDVSIPNKNLSPNSSHVVSIRKKNTSTLEARPLLPIDYGSDLCKVAFTVGTPSAPGSVATPSTAAGQSGSSTGAALTCTGSDCTHAGGELCDGDKGVLTAIGCVHTDPSLLIKDIFRLAVGIGGGIAFLLMVFGAFGMITSAGNPDALKEAKERFTNAIIGILFIVFSTLLLQIIGVNILSIPGFTK